MTEADELEMKAISVLFEVEDHKRMTLEEALKEFEITEEQYVKYCPETLKRIFGIEL